jgi:putative transposase
MLGYRFRLYPSGEQEKTLLEILEACRFVYNKVLEWLNGGESNLFELKRRLPKLKEENPWLRKAYSQSLQNEVFRVFKNLRVLSALKRNGRKVGRLRYKGRGWFKSFAYPQSGFRLENGKLVLSKVGEIPIELHREIKGKVKGVIIKLEKSGKWFAIFQVEDEPEPLPETGRAIGIDVGVKHFLTDSEGRQVENPRFYERTLERIRRRQKKLSRKRKGSKNREKARVRLARAYKKLVNQRDDFLHKLSRFYVDNYDLIAVERLNISGMVRNHRLGGKILDASWGKFLQMLSYKAERAGRRVVEVDPRGTSQNLPGGIDRDYVAACRILSLGLGRPEVTPVEMVPPRELVSVPASTVVESGSPHPFTGG